jgi:hypothetical protein
MSAPKKKSRAMKQPDGSFLLEQIEDEQHG